MNCKYYLQQQSHLQSVAYFNHKSKGYNDVLQRTKDINDLVLQM